MLADLERCLAWEIIENAQNDGISA